MYRRDHFNEALVVERCAELVAIEARVSEIDAARQGRGPPAAAAGDLHLRCAAPYRGALLPSCGRPSAFEDDTTGKTPRRERRAVDLSPVPRVGRCRTEVLPRVRSSAPRQGPPRARCRPRREHSGSGSERSPPSPARYGDRGRVAADETGADSILTATGEQRHAADPGGRATEQARRLAAEPGRLDDRARLDPQGRKDATGPSPGRPACPYTRACARRRFDSSRFASLRPLLDDVRRPLPERGRRDGVAPRTHGDQGRPRPTARALIVFQIDNDRD